LFSLPFVQRGIPKFIETLNFRKLKVGMQLLGAVREINELDLVVSLPNGLAGYVTLAEVSDVMADRVAAFVAKADESDESDDEENGDKKQEDELPRLADLFRLGQLVRCVIVRLDDDGANKRIELTLRASVVNRGLQSDSIQPGSVIYGAIKSIEGLNISIRSSSHTRFLFIFPYHG
jgi:rRNA biogenesis protein RRP5